MSMMDRFEELDIRAGTLVAAARHPRARIRAIQVTIDFGDLGVRRSRAQITAYYTPDAPLGRQVVAVTNLPPALTSDGLVLGAVQPDHGVILLTPDRAVPDGCRVA